MINALARLGYPRAVLHVLADNHSAVRLYSNKGWRPEGAPFQHSLLKRPAQTYSICLPQPRYQSPFHRPSRFDVGQP